MNGINNTDRRNVSSSSGDERNVGESDDRSPINDEEWDPIGLKYLREILFVLDSCNIYSHFCLVSAYGEVALLNGLFSSTGNSSGSPYTVQEDEKIIFWILNSFIFSSIEFKELILFL